MRNSRRIACLNKLRSRRLKKFNLNPEFIMDSLEFLQKVLESSVKKNGEIPLTNRHLLNIVKMAIRWEEEHDEDVSFTHDMWMSSVMND